MTTFNESPNFLRDFQKGALRFNAKQHEFPGKEEGVWTRQAFPFSIRIYEREKYLYVTARLTVRHIASDLLRYVRIFDLNDERNGCYFTKSGEARIQRHNGETLIIQLEVSKGRWSY